MNHITLLQIRDTRTASRSVICSVHLTDQYWAIIRFVLVFSFFLIDYIVIWSVPYQLQNLIGVILLWSYQQSQRDGFLLVKIPSQEGGSRNAPFSAEEESLNWSALESGSASLKKTSRTQSQNTTAVSTNNLISD